MDIKTFRRATPSSVGRSGKIGHFGNGVLSFTTSKLNIAQGKTDTETNSVVPVGFKTNAEYCLSNSGQSFVFIQLASASLCVHLTALHSFSFFQLQL